MNHISGMAPSQDRGGMIRALRTLEPTPVLKLRGARQAHTNALFWVGLVAVLMQFLLPYVVLDAMGLPTVKVKLHPATVLVILAAAYALFTGRLQVQRRIKDAPGLMFFILAAPVLAFYSMYFTGFSGSAIYPENYLSAGLLALLLEQGSDHQKRLLAKILIALCVFNVFVGLYESLTYNNWFPLVIDPDAKLTDVDVDFRANAFYNHPLTASLFTSMAVFLLYAMRLPFLASAPILGLFLVGLLAFGGRTALGVTLLAMVVTALLTLILGLVRRNLKLSFVVGMIFAAVTLPMLLTFIVTQTTIAERIMDTLYFDESAEVRKIQWEVFRYLSLQNWLFGISHDDLNVLKYQIGLGGKETDIENFWALMMLNLGGIGFALFVTAFGAFLLHLGNYVRHPQGWVLVIAAVVIDSGSNSLGTKCSDLFVEVGFLVAMSGYARMAAAPVRLTRPKTELRNFAKPQLALTYQPSGRIRALQPSVSRLS